MCWLISVGYSAAQQQNRLTHTLNPIGDIHPHIECGSNSTTAPLLLRDVPDDALTNRWNEYAVMLVKQALNGTASDSV